ncbi:uncharacterized protein I303_103669 [Kwoniella dejecticola CBS 10117]|uniref:J domain-containing protein n=1 Tax=Kwoniella dejecticola CBS 10117 TaxID=1296121 RepID=A0AAJ8KP17_9TREE
MTKAIRLDQPTYYQVLGIEEDAEPDEATEAFQGIQEAYEVLSDPERRSFYDEELESLRNPHPLPSPPVCSAAQDPPFILASTCTSDTYSSFPAPA